MAALPKFGLLPESHRVPDVLAPNLAVVFCGTALGQRSAAAKAYYANPGNLFWRALHETGITPHRLDPQEYPRVLEYGVGLTDLCKHAFGNDAELPPDAFDIAALKEKIGFYRPRILAFTSKTGAASFLGRATGEIAYGFQPETIGESRIYVLPSPSGHGRKYWRQEAWQALAEALRR